MLFKKKNIEILNLSKVLYNLIIKQSRTKEFYKFIGVPDTIDGRFELIILHFFFIDRVLNKNIKKDELIYQELLDIMYKDFDMSLREMGVGDLSVGKKIYHMTEAFSGRLLAYRSFNNNKNNTMINNTIRKNIYGTIKDIDTNHITIMKSYIVDSINYISKINFDKLSENSSIFLDLNRYIVNKEKGN